MKMYYTEDRSNGATGKDASPQVNHIIGLFHLTDWEPDEMDKITSLDVSEDMTTEDGVYVRRLV